MDKTRTMREIAQRVPKKKKQRGQQIRKWREALMEGVEEQDIKN